MEMSVRKIQLTSAKTLLENIERDEEIWTRKTTRADIELCLLSYCGCDFTPKYAKKDELTIKLKERLQIRINELMEDD